jgi:hypothetical protein
MLRIGAWLEHPHYGLGRITNHRGTRYVCSFASVGIREIESHEPGVHEAAAPPGGDPIKDALREVLEEYGFGGVAELGGRWEGGEVIVRPAKEGLKEHHLPVDALFHKVVMIRDRLRVLEQKINASKSLSDAEKLEMQQYVTRCYGSLTSLNFLFKRDEDKFSGSSG